MGEARLRSLASDGATSHVHHRFVHAPSSRFAERSAWSVGFGVLRRAALTGIVALSGLSPVTDATAATGLSRFASYASEAECVGSHTLTANVCRSAFANARQEYEARTPSFPSDILCRKRYATCMAWPPDASPGRPTAYRPEWDGVDIVDTPTEQTVTPSPGSTGRSIRFAARPLTAEPQRDLLIRGAAAGSRAAAVARSGRPTFGAPIVQRAAGSATPDRELPPSVPPPPGSGFKLEDGVLTYPAPERFQPRNLPKLN